jgi:D-alanyl-D-alanine carboxypeptidase
MGGGVRRRLGLLGAALAGALAGTVAMLSLPVGGYRAGPDFPAPSPRLPILGMAPVPTMLAWTSGGIPPGFAEAVRGLPSVRSVTSVRSGIAWLDAWEDASGRRDRPRRGYRIPLEVAAVDPVSYASFVSPAERPAVRGLTGGGAILGESGAEIRDIGTGGRLRFGGRTLRVEAVLADELVGAHEAVVSKEVGRGLGIVRERYLLILPRPGVAHRQVERALYRISPAGIPLRVRAPGETPVFRHGDAALPMVRYKEVFGEFAAKPAAGGFIEPDPRWVNENIQRRVLPVLGQVHCHRLVIPLLREVLSDLVRRGLGDLIREYAGCYSPRFNNRDPSTTLSHHSWGAAVDINVSTNRLGAEPTMDPRVVDTFERWGFTWGGRWLVPDGMHFEFQRYPTLA